MTVQLQKIQRDGVSGGLQEISKTKKKSTSKSGHNSTYIKCNDIEDESGRYCREESDSKIKIKVKNGKGSDLYPPSSKENVQIISIRNPVKENERGKRINLNSCISEVTVHCTKDISASEKSDTKKTKAKKILKTCYLVPNELQELRAFSRQSTQEKTIQRTKSAIVPNRTEVFHLKEHCRSLEGEIENIKTEIVNIISEKDICSKENKNLRDYQLAYEDMKEENRKLKEELDTLRVKDMSSRSESCDGDRSSPDGQEIIDIHQVEDNNSSGEKDEKINSVEKSAMEESLKLMEAEFENMEAYWGNKLNEERILFQENIFGKERKIKELENGQEINEENPCWMPERTASLEIKVSELEKNILDLKCLMEENNLKHSNYVEQIQFAHQVELSELLASKTICNCWDKEEISTNPDNLIKTSDDETRQKSPDISGRKSMSSEIQGDSFDLENLTTNKNSKVPRKTKKTRSCLDDELIKKVIKEVACFQNLREIIQQECDLLLLEKERLREEVDSFEYSDN